MQTNPTKTILIVDDSPTVRGMIRLILSNDDQNYELLEASNGLEAVKILNAETVDLVITDIQMPEMDGFELVKKIKQDMNPNIPIIVMTGIEQYISVFELACLLSSNAFIMKSDIPERLLSTVNNRLR